MAKKKRPDRDRKPAAKPAATPAAAPPSQPPAAAAAAGNQAGGNGSGGGGGGDGGPPVDNQPASMDPGTPPDTEDSGLNTRDMNQLPTDGPQLTQYESPTARNVDGMAQALAQRPQFSPVAQPGIGPNIWWHTVEDPMAEAQGAATTNAYYQPQPTQGMFTRLEERIGQPRHHGGRGRGRGDDDDPRKKKPKRKWRRKRKGDGGGDQ